MSDIYYKIHRSTARLILMRVMAYPKYYTNLQLAEFLEDSFPDRNRKYLVLDDGINLTGDFVINDIAEFNYGIR